MSAGLRGNGVVAVLREAKSKWERRAALTPDHVSTLVKHAAPLPSFVTLWSGTHRVFTDSQYVAAGAALQDDVSPASVILGVKEVPVELLIPNRTYVSRAPCICI
jgi:alpha-aminoadipic semialdehyde synthase